MAGPATVTIRASFTANAVGPSARVPALNVTMQTTSMLDFIADSIYWYFPPQMVTGKRIRYRDAGVNIDEADRAVGAIKKMAQRTFTRGVLTDIGTFGACYALTGLKKPVLVSSVDGVGTKLKIAFATGRHDTIGQDLVNHCVNDIAVQGATPLFFLDYFAVGKLDADVCSS